MTQLGAIAALAASLMVAALFSAIHKIEEGHIGVYYRYVGAPGGSSTFGLFRLLQSGTSHSVHFAMRSLSVSGMERGYTDFQSCL